MLQHNTVKSRIEKGHIIMGLINRNRKKPGSIDSDKSLHKNLDFTASEQYKLLRTNILFTLPNDVKCPIIGVTSSTIGEGKSTTSINLSYVLAENGSRVLLIDGDLRLPSIAKKMEIKSTPGLTDMLINPNPDIEGLKTSLNEKWYVLPSGELPPNPSELLGSKRMEKLLDSFKEKFDYIIVDLPPVNLVSDAVSIAPFINGMIVVIREDYVTKKELEQCIRQLEFSNVKVLGCVMTECGSTVSYSKGGKYRSGKYYKYYRYQSYAPKNDQNAK